MVSKLTEPKTFLNGYRSVLYSYVQNLQWYHAPMTLKGPLVYKLDRPSIPSAFIAISYRGFNIEGGMNTVIDRAFYDRPLTSIISSIHDIIGSADERL